LIKRNSTGPHVATYAALVRTAPIKVTQTSRKLFSNTRAPLYRISGGACQRPGMNTAARVVLR
jgi:hypothetical protein